MRAGSRYIDRFVAVEIGIIIPGNSGKSAAKINTKNLF
jgi:hypothetical protein